MPWIDAAFFARDTLLVARELIGAELIVGRCAGRIVETEAYTTDAASHAVTRRHKAVLMRETFGHVYVYKIYGMHYCLNFTTEERGVGAVLIRAIEPLRGLSAMRRRRGVEAIGQLASGPGRLCQALGVDLADNGLAVGARVKLQARSDAPLVTAGPRVGVSQARELNWRFFLAGHPCVSRGPRA